MTPNSGQEFAVAPVRLAFLADALVEVLAKNDPLTEHELKAVSEALKFVESAHDGGLEIVRREFRAATAKQFAAFEWTARACVESVGRDAAKSSVEVSEFLARVRETLRDFANGEAIEPEKVKEATQFFAALRDVVLATTRRTPKEPLVRSA